MSERQNGPEDDDLRTFMARKLGEMYAEVAKQIAANVATPGDVDSLARRNRYLLYLIVVLLLILLIVVAAHAAYSAGWLGR